MEQKYLAATRQDFISEYQVISGYLRDMLYDDSTNYRGATASFFNYIHGLYHIGICMYKNQHLYYEIY